MDTALLRSSDGSSLRLSVDEDGYGEGSNAGRIRYKWRCEYHADGMPEDDGYWSASDLHGPAGGPGECDVRTLASFLSAALESRSFRNRTGRQGDNEELFPSDMLDVCEQFSDDIAMLDIDDDEVSDYYDDSDDYDDIDEE